MSTANPTTATRGGRVIGRGSAVGRVLALTKMELRLLSRNKTAAFNAIAASPLMVMLLFGVIGDRVGDAGLGVLGGATLTSLAAFALLFVAYYNLTTTAVARREELMIKRLVAGECSRAEILLGMVTPAAVVLVGQMVLGAAAVFVVLAPPAMVNPILVLLALVLGTAVFALLAYATSGLTKSVESAQLTTLPLAVFAFSLSGLMVPMANLPDAAQFACSLTPLAPVVTLLGLGFNGLTPDGEQVTFAGSLTPALAPLGVLVAWIVIGVVAANAWMRWEPRR